MAYTLPASLVSNTVLTTTTLGIIVDNFSILSLHNHSGSLGEGNNILAAASGDIGGSLLYRTTVFPHDKDTVPATFRLRNYVYSNGASDDELGNNFNIANNLPMPISVWQITACAGSPVASGIGLVTENYLQTGSYDFTLYYFSSPSGGTLRINSNGSTLISEVDTYQSASSLKRFTTSFYNGGSIPILLGFYIAASKNVSAATCFLYLGPYCLQWTGA